MTEQAIAFLLAESFEHGHAEAIGASLASLHYTEPAVTGRTQEVLAQQLLEGLPADQVVALQPRLAALLGGVAGGFSRQARETILTQQETIRGALIGELHQAQQALEKAYGEVEQQVQHRTAELRETNESLRREIVEREQAEEALRESEETARALLNAPPDLASLIDTGGFILDANEAMAQRYETDVNELIGTYSWDLIPPDVAERRKPYFDQVIGSGKPVHFEDKRQGRWFYTVFYPVLDVQEKVTKVAVLSRDIDDRKRAEEELRKAHDELEMRVQERTAELAQANEALQAEIMVRKRAEEAIRRERDLAEALAEAAAVVSSSLDPDQVLDRILEQVSRVVPNDATNIMLIEDNQARIVRWRGYERFGVEELAPQAVFRVPETHGFQKMIASGEPTVIPDTVTYPDWVHIPGMEWLKSYAAAPIAVRGQVVGFLNVDSATPDFFTQAHAETLRVFADHAAAAIENAQLYENVQQELDERKRAEEDLRQSEERYRTLFDGVPVGLYRTTPDGRFLDANPALAQMLGYPDRESLLAIRSADTWVNPEERQWWQRAMEQEGSVSNFDHRNRRADGTVFWMRGTARVVRDANGQVLYYEGSVQDITERKQAEEDLQESEQRFRSLFETMTEGVVVIAPDGQITQANRAAENILGLKHSEIEGRDYVGPEWETFHLDGTPMPPEEMAGPRTMEEKRVVKDVVMGIKRPDGSASWINVSAAPLINAAGELDGIVGTFADITERKKAEEELRDREATMRALLNAPIEMATLMDADGVIIGANEATARGLGKNVDELIGSCVYDLFPPAVAKSRKAQADRVFRSGSPVRYDDERKGMVFDCNLYPIFDAEGKVAGIAAYARDITLRKQADERIRAYQDQLRSLASELSLTEERERRDIATALHDRVGQTLAICKIKLGALRQSASSSEFSEPLEEIHKYIEEVIQDTRSLTFEISSPILYQLGLEAALEWLTEETRKREGIRTQFRDDGQPKPLDDDVQIVLFQAVRELLVNVVKHAQAQRVEVAIGRNDNYVRIVVEDDGVGFDYFPIGSHWREITGFGLFSIRERLGHLGGHTHITSNPGLGTKIILLAPLKRDDATESEETT